jgi:hypothetical protein
VFDTILYPHPPVAFCHWSQPWWPAEVSTQMVSCDSTISLVRLESLQGVSWKVSTSFWTHPTCLIT